VRPEASHGDMLVALANPARVTNEPRPAFKLAISNLEKQPFAVTDAMGGGGLEPPTPCL
jgi:hypothetical protein